MILVPENYCFSNDKANDKAFKMTPRIFVSIINYRPDMIMGTMMHKNKRAFNLINPFPDKTSLETKCAINCFPVITNISVAVPHGM